jgi:hypothetical protein
VEWFEGVLSEGRGLTYWPLGIVGKQFKSDGAVGGTAQQGKLPRAVVS